MIRFGLIVFLIFSTLHLTFSQRSTCSETLEEARRNFDAGHLYIIPSILKPCLDNGFNRSQKIEAYLILTRTYLLIDDPISAEDNYLKLLKLDPEYKIDPERDPVDIIYLNEKFKTTPIFIFFAKVGINSSNASSIGNYGVDNTSRSNEKYTSAIGFNIGGGSEFNVSDHFSIGLEVNFHSKKYEYSNTLFEGDLQTFTEKQSLLGVPLFLKYRLHFNKIHPFIYGGLSYQYLISAKADVIIKDRSSNAEGIVSEFSVTGPPVSLDDLRTSINKFGILGIGFNYRIGYDYLFFDARYYLGVTNFVDEKSQYSNSSLLYKYGYVDDFKRMNTVSISFGYIHPIYKPRKNISKENFFKRLLK
jgi:hypothetical protein